MDTRAASIPSPPHRADAPSELDRGLHFLRLNKLAPALEHFLAVLEREPDNLETLRLAGVTAMGLYKLELALDLLHRTRTAFLAEGRRHKVAGRRAEAARAFGVAAQTHPLLAEALANLSASHRESGDADKAASCARQALELSPDSVEGLHNLGLALRDQGLPVQAEEAFRRALALRPEEPKTWNNLGNVLLDQTRYAEAAEAYGRSLTLSPDQPQTRSNMLLASNYRHDLSTSAMLRLHTEWSLAHETPAPAVTTPPPPSGAGAGPLRVGFISPDFRSHSVAWFSYPALKGLAEAYGECFTLFCYSTTTRPDATTERFRRLPVRWRAMAGASPDAAAAAIASDRLDVLVDLSGHTATSALPICARTPAPVLASWMGYPNTTGMARMNYRLTDATADPPGLAEPLHTERLERLAPVFLCYGRPDNAPPVTPPPCLTKRTITFGSFNNLAKVGPRTLDLWSRLLLQAPGSRLLLKSKPLAEERLRERFLHEFARRGVLPGRVEFLPRTPSLAGHLALYGLVDIALDTFPYNGTTTTCEALWMGTPVVTIAGDRHAARVGASLLGALGLDECIGRSGADFVARSAALAGDIEKLRRHKATLRDRMAASPLCNRFTHADALARALWSMAGYHDSPEDTP